MIQKSSTERTLEFFFTNPTKAAYLRDISRSIKIAHTSVKKNLDKLIKFKLIKKTIEKLGDREYPKYFPNLESNSFKTLKANYNLSILGDSKLIQYIEEKIMPKSIVLFGSFQRGEDIESSDIDIFVECEYEELNLKAFEKKLNRKIEIHFKKDFTKYPKELKNNILNGTVVSGFLEGYK